MQYVTVHQDALRFFLTPGLKLNMTFVIIVTYIRAIQISWNDNLFNVFTIDEIAALHVKRLSSGCKLSALI